MDERGFGTVTRLPAARDRLRERCEPHGRTATRSVSECDGQVLATPVVADRPVPHYDRAAMDGYAVRARDTFDAGERSPARLSLADDRLAAEHVTAAAAVQVHTGSALPDGADAVVRVEQTERRDGDVLVYGAVAGGENVAAAGEDVEAGERLLDAGHRLRPSDLALCRATGQETVDVFARPRASVVPTGEELVEPGAEPDPGEVVETNGLLASRLAARWGGEATYRDVVADDAGALRDAIERDSDHDVVVTTGGSSVGDRDLVAEVVADAGEVCVHGVAIKPGHPVGFGVVADTPVLFLPGYPVSCLVTAVQFLRPALAWLSGTSPRPHPSVRGQLTQKLRSEPGERTFARVRVPDGLPGDGVADDGTRSDNDSRPDDDYRSDDGYRPDGDALPAVEPVHVGGAGVMSSVAAADGWVTIPESREGIPAGETVSVEVWE